jgi:hypothetical protein
MARWFSRRRVILYRVPLVRNREAAACSKQPGEQAIAVTVQRRAQPWKPLKSFGPVAAKLSGLLIAFRFDVNEVYIRSHGSAVILRLIPDNWAWLDQVTGPLDDGFVNAVAKAQVRL